MNKKTFLSGLLLITLTGCVDTIDSVAREYRNSINEGIDAMMMVNSEAQAKDMKMRIFKDLAPRFQALEKKLGIIKINRASPKEFLQEIFDSNGAHMYLTELDANSQRFALEMTRLRTLTRHYVDQGDSTPILNEMVNGTLLDPLQSQLDHPKLLEMMVQVNTAKMVDFDKMFLKFLEKRQEFKPKTNVVLVN
jgi:hypothetical protein